MAGDDVPAEFIANLERAFQIDARAPPPVPYRGQAQCLGGGLDREPAAIALLAARDDGQAYAAAGNRRAGADAVRTIAAGDCKAREPLRPRFDRRHLANIGDDAGEHVTPARMSRPYPPQWLRCRAP